MKTAKDYLLSLLSAYADTERKLEQARANVKALTQNLSQLRGAIDVLQMLSQDTETNTNGTPN